MNGENKVLSASYGIVAAVAEASAKRDEAVKKGREHAQAMKIFAAQMAGRYHADCAQGKQGSLVDVIADISARRDEFSKGR